MPAAGQESHRAVPNTGSVVVPIVPLPHEPAAPSGAPTGQRVTYRIENMDCPTEEALIRDRLGKEPGVSGLDFNLMQRVLGVQHTLPSTKPIEKALASIGMRAVREVETIGGPAEPAAPAGKTAWWPLAVSGVAAALAEGVYWANDGLHWAVVALALVSILTGGLETYKKGWIAIRNGNLNMNALMAIAVTGGMAIGHWPEAAMVMFLFALAEVIEAKSLDRARNAIRGLMDLAPETTTVRQADGSWKELAAKEVAIDSVVRVGPGERIALDGAITSGRSAINQAAITGESLPRKKGEGESGVRGHH